MEREINAWAKLHGLKILCKQVIENQIWGLRVWRLDDTVAVRSPPVDN